MINSSSSAEIGPTRRDINYAYWWICLWVKAGKCHCKLEVMTSSINAWSSSGWLESGFRILGRAAEGGEACVSYTTIIIVIVPVLVLVELWCRHGRRTPSPPSTQLEHGWLRGCLPHQEVQQSSSLCRPELKTKFWVQEIQTQTTLSSSPKDFQAKRKHKLANKRNKKVK